MKRRDFLKSLGIGASVTGFLHGSILKASILPANSRTSSLEDVEHIVVFMQENRSFDHYFGHLNGVRGYNDRFPLELPGGNPIWFQPRPNDISNSILPFWLDTSTTSAQFLQDLDHDWYSQHGAIAGGLMNAWAVNKTEMTMGYFRRQDLPFHYALADSFTVCDHYFASIAGPTCPNRSMLFTGTIDPDGEGGGPFIDDNTWNYSPLGFRESNVKPFRWGTYAERLQASGISWCVYQDGLEPVNDDPLTGNFGDNPLPWFQTFATAPKSSELYKRGMAGGGLSRLSDDVRNNRLPQVSWIVTPAGYSEHPSYPPAYGAIYISRVLDILTSNPAVWSKTALFLNYDENDGFFDHVPPPQPPTPVRPGMSTVSTAGEVHNKINPDWPVLYTPDQLPYGLGPRVPMIVISPWSRGGFVNSEVFDHTSVIRFIEKRFGVTEPNIAPWRRAVCGDLTSAFDFSKENDRLVSLPSTKNYSEVVHYESSLPLPRVPERQDRFIIPQEVGLRRRRPIAYDTRVQLIATDTTVKLRLHNHSPLGVVCIAYVDGSNKPPLHYTVGARDKIDDVISVAPSSNISITVYGPDGFVRKISGLGKSSLVVDSWGTREGNLVVHLQNVANDPMVIDISDQAYHQKMQKVRLEASESKEVIWPLSDSHHWYDLSVRTHSHQWRLAGHVETGSNSWSDPANTDPILKL